ncbi:PQQ-binding-like beta-propeller repeat protein [Kitasatospora sp. NPDC127059]|uniref:outer membrane protein assembly factor BamB family protein n=1 Tax=unclassified Kitasatospora TaxID=2633591 RepID=UPI003656CB26
MKSSEGPAREAAWQWDGPVDGAGGVSGDVIGQGPDGGGPRLSRRGLLAGAGALAVGGAAWALSRAGRGPTPGPSRPQPTGVSGPAPLWTYRGAQAMTPERLLAPPPRPVFLSKAGLQVLDPAGGDPRRLLVFDPPRPTDWPSDLELPGGKVAIGPEHLFSTESKGHLDAHHLSDPAGDWSLPLPEELQGQCKLTGMDGGVLFGFAWGRGRPEQTSAENRVFALRPTDRSLLWSLPAVQQELPVTPLAADGKYLACARSLGDHSLLVVRRAADGQELWTAPGQEDLRWCAADAGRLYLPDGTGGVRTLRVSGEPDWTASPARGESWRALPPLPDGPQVYVPRDDGVVTAHDTETGAVRWTCRVPFLLDRRSRPLVAVGTLFVPGPAAGGVCAIDTRSGRLLWTFRDSGPGRDVWAVAVDDRRLYAGHDDVLHALPLL